MPSAGACRSTPSTRTVSDIRAALRAALSRAQAQDLIVKNPAIPVTLATVRRHRGKSWSSDEVRKFLESARRDEDPLYAAYALVLVVGLRKGETLGLTWDNVDLDAGELTVGHQLQRSMANSCTATRRRRHQTRSCPCRKSA
ncbi:integrase [Plantactinospora soyae]|uniref:Integrase n=1 Tax=Plantactinospora soyae TaxID=1544732 RepID=A0A927M5Y9_9ACTN|nr:integrase [Plantactinospora soyae]